jgi:SAM-dependent methyltransferase
VSGLTYNPAVFAVQDLQQAKAIILTPEDSTTEARWQTETGYLADMIEEQLELNPGVTLLDYGCGIGRLSKALIERQNCGVLGVDISAHMRMLSIRYVDSDLFTPCSPELLDALLASGLKLDAAISVWVLQHCRAPAEDIALIEAALKPGAPFFVVNNHGRAVPTQERGWVDDGIDIRELLTRGFVLEEQGRLLPEKTTPSLAENCFWARFRRRPE